MESELELRLLGPLRVLRHGEALSLPASRKARALLAYLALSPRPVSRSQLCELLWDAPGDPRGELRWCLSKIRGLLEDDSRERVRTEGDAIALDLSGLRVDALEVTRAADEGLATLGLERQRALAALFEGDFLEGLEIERAPAFSGWLTAQRRRLRACHAALLEALARNAPAEQALAYLEKWRELAPFDLRAHEALLSALARQNRLREGEEHLAAAVRLFESEGLDGGPLRNAWRTARGGADASVQLVMPDEAHPPEARQRASIAVMPFVDHSSGALARGGIADALAHDVITRLAKLRSLFVIAQGTVFELHERRVGAEEAGRILDVDYVASGSVRAQAGRCTVTVDLVETRSARVVWAETYQPKLGGTLELLDEIGDRIVASIASEIELLERNRAILKPPSSLDAWEAYHRGLWHMYRYRKVDNDQARHFFQVAVRLDPTFSRAHASLSFTHFQDAFQGWEDRAPQIELAYQAASQGLLADERDPAAHWAMGRALWLRGGTEQALGELERSVDLSPNFALGHYNLAFVRSLAGDPSAAIAAADHSRELSPFDPMLFGMLASRAMSLVRLERFDEASAWAVKAAARPNAFPHIHAIAAFSLALAGSLEQARVHAETTRRAAPGYNLSEFLLAFPFEPQGEALFRKGARLLGME